MPINIVFQLHAQTAELVLWHFYLLTELVPFDDASYCVMFVNRDVRLFLLID